MTISVAMATYNGAAYLRQQLDSILAQTRPPEELVVCDDCSTDETVPILREYAEHSRVPIRIFVNESNLRSTKNFEKAIGLCTGDIIALSDQDDVWLPHKLQIIEDRFAGEPDLGLVFSNGFLIDETGKRLPRDMWSRFLFHTHLQRRLSDASKAYDLLLSRYFITGATVAFRSKFRGALSPIPDKIEAFIHDRWIAIVVAAVARIGLIYDHLIEYRLHPDQQMGVGNTPILKQFFTPANCSSDLSALGALANRLTQDSAVPADPAFLSALATRQQHIEARERLSGHIIRRFIDVIREYMTGRYGRYSLGPAHAVRDVLVGTR
jgi:glycosyltransferase involved in cell wall biosynthesis